MKISLDNGQTWQEVDKLLVRTAYKEEFLEIPEDSKDSKDEEGVTVESKVEIYFDFNDDQVSMDYWIDDEHINTKIQTYMEIGEDLGME